MSELAINGGSAVRGKAWPVWPIWDESEIQAVRRVFECGQWGIGSPIVKEFETAFAEMYGAKHAISCTNGSHAIVVALQALGVKAGDEVIVPPYTFIATATAVLAIGAVPVFVDIHPDTYNLDPALIDPAITERTRCIIPVHIAGNPADMHPILEIAKKYDLPVIEDTAQAHLARYEGKTVGTIGNAGTWSFQSSKNHSSGEGGIICTNDDALIDMLFSYQNCGRVRNGKWYDHHYLGSNFRLSAFQAAVLLSQMKRVEEQTRLREKNARYLEQLLDPLPGIRYQIRHERTERHAYHLFILRYHAEDFGGLPRKDFIRAMQAEGISCDQGYIPLYKFPLFQRLPDEVPAVYACGNNVPDYSTLACPVCERVCKEEAIWFYQYMFLGEPSDMDDIAEAIEKIRKYQHTIPRE